MAYRDDSELSRSVEHGFRSAPDFLMDAGEIVTNVFQSVFGAAAPSMQPARPKADPSAADPAARSWIGEDGLKFRVPLVQLPSEEHTRTKLRNIRIVLENVRVMCAEDLLPSTEDEKKFWAQYQLLRMKLFLQPFCAMMPITYFAARKVQHRIATRAFRGRALPIMFTGMLAEQIAEFTYPHHELLCTALARQTPLGDAARAEWQRMQPVPISMYLYTAWYWSAINGEILPGFAFGGNPREELMGRE